MQSCSKLLNYSIQVDNQLIEHAMFVYHQSFFETHIKDFKSSDIQHSNEELSWLLCVQHLIDTDDHPQEHFLIDGLAQSTDSIVDLDIRILVCCVL